MKNKPYIGQKVKFLTAPFGPYRHITITKINNYYITGRDKYGEYTVGVKMIKPLKKKTL